MPDPFTPGMSSATFAIDRLIAGSYPQVTDTGTLAAGHVLKRGALLGRIGGIAITAAAKVGGNTGNGTIGAVALGPEPVAGAYTLSAVAGTSTFAVTGPAGNPMPDLTVGQAYDQPAFGCQITVGATAFSATDGFVVTISAGSGVLTLSTAAATDGSQVPVAILADDVDASAGPAAGPIYLTGEFNENAVTYGAGFTADGVRGALATRGIFLKPAVSAAAPT
jgi:Bacteriophage lambda head decoration protein D